MVQHKFHETSRFFILMMIVLFIVSYFFWGVLFLGPQRGDQPLRRGLHNTVGSSQQGSQRGMFPGMGGGMRRSEGGSNQGGMRSSTQGGNRGSSTTMVR